MFHQAFRNRNASGLGPPESGFSIDFFIERGSEAGVRETVTSEGLR